MKNRIIHGFNFIVNVQAVIAAALALILMILVGLDVMLKYLLSHPIEGVLEITSEYLMPILVLLGFAYAERKRAHVNVDLLFQFFPDKMKRIMDGIIQIVTIAFLAVMAYSFYLRALYYTKINAYIDLISYDLATWPARWLATIGLISFALQVVVNMMTSHTRGENV